MPHSLDVKEHLILSSVLPAAFHGAETRPLSGEQTNFDQRWQWRCLAHFIRCHQQLSLYLCKRGFYFYKRVFEKLCLFNITCQRPCGLHLCCLKVCVSWKASSQRTCAVIAIFLESIPCEIMLT